MIAGCLSGLRPTPDRSVGQTEQRLAATIVTRKGGDAKRLRSPALGRRLERGPTGEEGAAHGWAAYELRAAIIAFQLKDRVGPDVTTMVIVDNHRRG